jgi:hypothetical protein
MSSWFHGSLVSATFGKLTLQIFPVPAPRDQKTGDAASHRTSEDDKWSSVVAVCGEASTEAASHYQSEHHRFHPLVYRRLYCLQRVES